MVSFFRIFSLNLQEFLVENLNLCKPVLNRLEKTEFGSWTRNASEVLALGIVHRGESQLLSKSEIKNVSIELSISTLPFDEFTMKSWLGLKVGDSIVCANVEAENGGFKINFVKHAWFKTMQVSINMITLTAEFEAGPNENLKSLDSANFITKITDLQAGELQLLHVLRESLKQPQTSLPDIIGDYLLGIEDIVDFGLKVSDDCLSFLPSLPSHFTDDQRKCFKSVFESKLSISYGPFAAGITSVMIQTTALLAARNERTVIVTKSEAGLDRIYSELISAGVKECYLARPGMGSDFSNFSKRYSSLLHDSINAINKKICLPLGLSEVESCNDCEYLWKVIILPQWKAFSYILNSGVDMQGLMSSYPFLKCSAFEIESFEGHFYGIAGLFENVRELATIELLKGSESVASFVLSNLSRVILMTSSFSVSHRHVLANMNIEIDNMFVDDAQMIPEAESLLHLSLQKNTGVLKRLAFFGHNMLNSSLTLFQRFLAYGFADSNIFSAPVNPVSPFSLLKNNSPQLQGHLQFVDIVPTLAAGEEQPIKDYFQNLDEAEFAVALYQVLRILGVDAEEIVIISTSQGQVHLIQEVLSRRCDWNEFFGKPKFIGTIEESCGVSSNRKL